MTRPGSKSVHCKPVGPLLHPSRGLLRSYCPGRSHPSPGQVIRRFTGRVCSPISTRRDLGCSRDESGCTPHFSSVCSSRTAVSVTEQYLSVALSPGHCDSLVRTLWRKPAEVGVYVCSCLSSAHPHTSVTCTSHPHNSYSSKPHLSLSNNELLLSSSYTVSLRPLIRCFNAYRHVPLLQSSLILYS